MLSSKGSLEQDFLDAGLNSDHIEGPSGNPDLRSVMSHFVEDEPNHLEITVLLI